MENFVAYNPTRLHFGKDALKDLGRHAADLGTHALLVYGGGSVRRNGSYSDARSQLDAHGIRITEYSGIKSNPVVEDVDRAIELGRREQVDLVVAVGGGSVIDSAKIIALGIAEQVGGWTLMSRNHEPASSLPLLAVLTLAATGTEMNGVAVLQNSRTREKIGFRNELIYPVHSFLDPTYTLTVPEHYTAYGVVDLTAHCLEAWFGEGEAPLSDRFVVAIIREALEYGPSLMKSPDNYDLRARIMWAATNALNNLTMYGRSSGDWGVHALGHTLSFLYDTPHGASLSIMYPAWMKRMQDRAGGRIGELGSALFGDPSVTGTIDRLETFFGSLGSPVRCRQAGIGPEKKAEVRDLMNENRSSGLHHELSDEDREEILENAFSG